MASRRIPIIAMKTLEELLKHRRQIRVIGFDDAPFDPITSKEVHVTGIVCAQTRFEGMLWGQLRKDGLDATDVLSELLRRSKFLEQVHLILIDGIALGGFNIVDLPELSTRLGRPCVAVVRKPPNMPSIISALRNLPDFEERTRLLSRAGTIHSAGKILFQVAGTQAETVKRVLPQLTDKGHIPEALRLAHLIGSAVVTGQSGHRA